MNWDARHEVGRQERLEELTKLFVASGLIVAADPGLHRGLVAALRRASRPAR